jgi:hypothetical protein
MRLIYVKRTNKALKKPEIFKSEMSVKVVIIAESKKNAPSIVSIFVSEIGNNKTVTVKTKFGFFSTFSEDASQIRFTVLLSGN